MGAEDRLKEAMRDAHIDSAADLARRSGINPVTVRAYLNGYRNLSFREPAEKLGLALGVSADWLLGTSRNKERRADDASSPARVDNRVGKLKVWAVAIRGIAQAGVWREYEEMDFEQIDPIPVIPGKWAHLEQFAYKVSGPSMNRLGITDGSFVICVAYFLARADFVHEDVVVVERRRGSTVERTVKRLRLAQNGAELWPESDDPRFQSPVFVSKNGDIHEDDGTEVEVVGLVIGRYAPM